MRDKKWLDFKKSTVRMVHAFAYKVAVKYNLELSYCIQKTEDIQLDCYQRFDESKKVKFSTYLYQSLKKLYSWAWEEKRMLAEIPDEIYNQIPAPEERHELEVPEHLKQLSDAIVLGYGFYFDNGRLSDTRRSLKDLVDYTGLTSNQVYLQLHELRKYLARK